MFKSISKLRILLQSKAPVISRGPGERTGNDTIQSVLWSATCQVDTGNYCSVLSRAQLLRVNQPDCVKLAVLRVTERVSLNVYD